MKLCYVLAGTIFLSGCQSLGLKEFTTKPTTTNSKQKINKAPETNEPLKPQANIKAVTQKTAKHTNKKKSPEKQSDVWQRIALQLNMPVPQNERIQHYRNWYLNNPRHLATVAERAKPFLYLITEQVEKRNIPLEIALLPIVESSFDQFAYSHGRAAGLWQFVPDTGKRFGLEQDFWYDGRRDVIASTEAALDLLEYLHRKFDGNWLHALAAYNTGEGRVFRAIHANEQKGLPTDFWTLSLPRETSSYVPKLLAVADIIKQQQRYGVALEPIANAPSVEVVHPKTQMDLAIAAEYAGLSLAEIQGLNPGYNHWATSPEGPTHLLLPKSTITKFKRNLEQNGNQGFKLTRYKVKSGDSLSHIAERHSTTVAMLKRTNNLTHSTIQTGQDLMIPTSAKNDKHQGLMTASQRIEKIITQRGGEQKLIYKVKSGDSLWTIAKKYQISYKALARTNGLKEDSALHAGKELIVWQKSSPKNIEDIRTIIYRIRQGDSLSTIANRYNVTVMDLVQWNNLNKQAYLQPGQKLKVQVSS